MNGRIRGVMPRYETYTHCMKKVKLTFRGTSCFGPDRRDIRSLGMLLVSPWEKNPSFGKSEFYFSREGSILTARAGRGN